MKWVIKDYDTPIIEVWESFNGDLYFVAEKHPDYCFGFVRLYNMPDCAEWGDFPTFEAQSLV